MGVNKPIEDIEATLLAATKSALRGAFAPTGSFSSGFNIGGPLQHPDRAYQKKTPRQWSPTQEIEWASTEEILQ